MKVREIVHKIAETNDNIVLAKDGSVNSFKNLCVSEQANESTTNPTVAQSQKPPATKGKSERPREKRRHKVNFTIKLPQGTEWQLVGEMKFDFAISADGNPTHAFVYDTRTFDDSQQGWLLYIVGGNTLIARFHDTFDDILKWLNRDGSPDWQFRLADLLLRANVKENPPKSLKSQSKRGRSA